MSRVRTHFCTLVARGYGAVSRPVRYGMNGTIPATMNSSEGSGDTSEALGTTVWPRFSKCSRKRRRISAVCMRGSRSFSAGWAPGRERPVWGGSAVRGVRAAPREGGVAPVRQRRGPAGAGPPLALADGRSGPHVGPEVADRLGQLTQAVGQRAGDALRGQLLRGPGQPADD